MFLDEAEIKVRGGRGGDGMLHFHREKYVPMGGPDGGDGGRGGDVLLRVDRGLNTLYHLHHRRLHSAEDGRRGGTSNKTGRSGADAVIPVPPGTLVREVSSGLLLGDLTGADQFLRVAKGGRGGRGNPHFASSSNQTPHLAEKGEPGEERQLKLELRLIAEVGLVGVPNAGKSTFLAAVTAAHPKIAAYPFTTTEPNLGVTTIDSRTLVLSDIPGLLEGAHLGVGLGFAFLRHVSRTRVLIHLLDGAGADPLADYSQINSEIALYDPEMVAKPQIVVLNKMDLAEAQGHWPEVREAMKREGKEVFAISALNRQGVREVLYRAAELVDALPAREIGSREIPVYRPVEEPDFRIVREADGAWRVRGRRIEKAAQMTFWEYDEAVQRFQRIMEAAGIYAALRSAGVKPGDTVRIGEKDLEWHD
ncbi:MAG: GTPase ObgE [Anaerolineales bacterium]|jgi:GTP-binding protein